MVEREGDEFTNDEEETQICEETQQLVIVTEKRSRLETVTELSASIQSKEEEVQGRKETLPVMRRKSSLVKKTVVCFLLRRGKVWVGRGGLKVVDG
ncbi:hypothetical protein PIB30_066894 [Stylosanthes scabra]|uniref:Uncharacterized protein n=1 Tax=Stylosanthes scabra TaxID=79078 RepID=A0ABU6VNE8_9FABA|nr:hypothetical protein [Stylosanthes scabra]